MFSRSAAFLSRTVHPSNQLLWSRRAISSTTVIHQAAASESQAEVVLVGCGAPNRGMGWYHAVQMLDKK
jgi:hypothetical protein